VQDRSIVVTPNLGLNGGHATSTRTAVHSYGANAPTVNVVFFNGSGTEEYPLGFSLAAFC
jgi:hypothetical protein